MKEPDPSDGVLVARTRRGESAAFDTLVRRHYRVAFAVALAILGNRSDAEDVSQDAWVRSLERLEDCREPERFLYWLLQIVRNAARNRIGYRRVRATEPLDPETEAGSGDPARDLRRDRLRERLEGALARLPDIQREIVLLHDLENWSHRESSAALGITEVMSRQHLFQARRRLREILGAEALGDEDHGG